jgi:hypothetical protein
MEGINTFLNHARQHDNVIKKKYKKSDLRQLINDFLPKSFMDFYEKLLKKGFLDKGVHFPNAVEYCIQNVKENRPKIFVPYVYDLDIKPYSQNWSPMSDRRVKSVELILSFKIIEFRFENKLHYFNILESFNHIPFFGERYIIGQFETSFFQRIISEFFEKKTIKPRCEICNRVEGNPFKTKYFYDENRALEIELNGKTKIHECQLEAMDQKQPSTFYRRAAYMRSMCEICITRIQITDISYLKSPNKKSDYRFLRKNELITNDFVAIESVKIIDRNIKFQNGAAFMLGRGTGKTPNWFEESEGLNSRGFSTFYDECNNQPIHHSKRKLT